MVLEVYKYPGHLPGATTLGTTAHAVMRVPVPSAGRD